MQSPLPPRVLQIVGLTMLVGFAVFWAITGKESALLVGAAGSLILAAQYERVRTTIKDMTQPGDTFQRLQTRGSIDTEGTSEETPSS